MRKKKQGSENDYFEIVWLPLYWYICPKKNCSGHIRQKNERREVVYASGGRFEGGHFFARDFTRTEDTPKNNFKCQKCGSTFWFKWRLKRRQPTEAEQAFIECVRNIGKKENAAQPST